MFSVYGTAGCSFRGEMGALPRVGPAASVGRSKRALSSQLDQAASDPLAHSLSASATDLAHRNALAAYAQTLKQEPERHPLTRVDEVMTRAVVTIFSSATVAQAWALLAHEHLGQAPVIGDNRVLVGLLSRADLLHPDRLPGPNDAASQWQALLASSVVDVMWTPVPSVAPHTDIRHVARVLLDSGLPGLPVADEVGLVIGFISRSDILRAVVADPPLDLWT